MPPELAKLDYAVLQQCMHCGMCLPTCPTYDHTLRERNSPRGRIAWMRRIADGELPLDQNFADEMSYCLGCLACQSACPAGVDYAHLFETARADVAASGPMGRFARLARWLLLDVLFHRPWRLRACGRVLWVYQKLGLQSLVRNLGILRLFPQRLRQLESQTPTVRPPFSAARIAEVERLANPTKRVLLLTGCVQDLLYAEVNRATVDVLLAHGCEVVTPRNQHCCGSLHAHNGALELARYHARANLDVYDLTGIDAIISNAGGCGSHLKHYGRLLEGDHKYQHKAKVWDAKLRDVHQWLAEIGWQWPAATSAPVRRVAYDESCHLRHGQKVSTPVYELLRRLPNVVLVPLPEADWCCGSAGVYSLTQPDESQRLLARKLAHLATTGADTLATANPGCMLQFENGLRAAGSPVRVMHTMQLAAETLAGSVSKSVGVGDI